MRCGDETRQGKDVRNISKYILCQRDVHCGYGGRVPAGVVVAVKKLLSGFILLLAGVVGWRATRKQKYLVAERSEK